MVISRKPTLFDSEVCGQAQTHIKDNTYPALDVCSAITLGSTFHYMFNLYTYAKHRFILQHVLRRVARHLLQCLQVVKVDRCNTRQQIVVQLKIPVGTHKHNPFIFVC